MEKDIDNYNNCPAKIHIDNIEKEIDEMKNSIRYNLDILYNRLDGIKNMLIGGFLSLTVTVVAGITIFLIIGK